MGETVTEYGDQSAGDGEVVCYHAGTTKDYKLADGVLILGFKTEHAQFSFHTDLFLSDT